MHRAAEELKETFDPDFHFNHGFTTSNRTVLSLYNPGSPHFRNMKLYFAVDTCQIVRFVQLQWNNTL